MAATICSSVNLDLRMLPPFRRASLSRNRWSEIPGAGHISARYERRSLLITANQPFGDWGRIFPDQAMTLAAIDRLVHHATILEMNVESYRRKTALARKRAPAR